MPKISGISVGIPINVRVGILSERIIWDDLGRRYTLISESDRSEICRGSQPHFSSLIFLIGWSSMMENTPRCDDQKSRNQYNSSDLLYGYHFFLHGRFFLPSSCFGVDQNSG